MPISSQNRCFRHRTHQQRSRSHANPDVRHLRRVRVVVGATHLGYPQRDTAARSATGRPGNLHRRQLRPHIFSSSDIDDHALPSQVRRVPALRLTGPSHDCFLGSVFARDQRNSPQVHGCCLEGALVLASVR